MIHASRFRKRLYTAVAWPLLATLVGIGSAAWFHTVPVPISWVTGGLCALAFGWLYWKIHHALGDLCTGLQHSQAEIQSHIEEATQELNNTLNMFAAQNEALKKAKIDAERASQIKSEFLANISHEIRTPMNGIMGFTHLLLKTPLTPTQEDYLLTVQQSAAGLLEMMNDLLDFSKIEAGILHIESETFALYDALEETVNLMAPLAQDKGLDLVLHLEPSCPTWIHSDPLRIQQIVRNLLSNAIKFTPQGFVLLHGWWTDNRLRLEVQDTGIGLSVADQTLIFDAFQQTDAGHNRQHGGAGLGLAICKKLIHAMGGEIGVISKPGQGATFWCELPHTTAVAHPEATPILPPKRTWSRLRTCLVYDPEPWVVRSVCGLLAQMGWPHQACADPQALAAQIQAIPAADVLVFCGGTTPVPGVFPDGTNPFPWIHMAKTPQDRPTAFLHPAVVRLAKPVLSRTLMACLEQADTYRHPTVPIPHSHRMVSPDVQPHSHPLDHYLAHVQPTTSRRHRTSQHPRILVVDDHPANLKLIQALLAPHPYAVTTVSSGQAACDWFTTHPVDLILMDIQMPEQDGLETTQRIRAMPDIQRIPIIALTAHALPEEKDHYLSHGMDDYLCKPIDETTLLNMLEKWLPIRPAIDWDLCVERAHRKPELAQELLTLFLKELPQSYHHIQTAFSQKDAATIAFHIHKMYGASCYTGVPDLQYKALVLKQALSRVQSGSLPDWPKLHGLWRALSRQIHLVLAYPLPEGMQESPALSSTLSSALPTDGATIPLCTTD